MAAPGRERGAPSVEERFAEMFEAEVIRRLHLFGIAVAKSAGRLRYAVAVVDGDMSATRGQRLDIST